MEAIQQKAIYMEDIRNFYGWVMPDSFQWSELEYNISYDVTKIKKTIKEEGLKSRTEWVDLISYCKMMAETHYNLEIFVGTDSQFYGGKAHYAVVVAFRYGDRGVHALHKKLVETLSSESYSKTKKIRLRKKSRGSGKNDVAIKERLNRETILSLATAWYIRESGKVTILTDNDKRGAKGDIVETLKIKSIDLDYNSKNQLQWVEENGKTVRKLVPLHLSGEVVQQNIGLCKGFNFETTLKPDVLIATPYADKLCR